MNCLKAFILKFIPVLSLLLLSQISTETEVFAAVHSGNHYLLHAQFNNLAEENEIKKTIVRVNNKRRLQVIQTDHQPVNFAIFSEHTFLPMEVVVAESCYFESKFVDLETLQFLHLFHLY